ncbi:hypothetical protein CEXT_272581 [Caerostris extrusa]|uniref:Uncharacterized protein n=1 Tax=Caerostris extrusa TaxID=172846 RepID=A0AAV4THP8_CAEEX|nr:hypothetical protein CEXT_272581 [Caerostris extrusa]
MRDASHTQKDECARKGLGGRLYATLCLTHTRLKGRTVFEFIIRRGFLFGLYEFSLGRIRLHLFEVEALAECFFSPRTGSSALYWMNPTKKEILRPETDKFQAEKPLKSLCTYAFPCEVLNMVAVDKSARTSKDIRVYQLKDKNVKNIKSFEST